MIDIHNHILPGLDDGVGSWDEALTLCELASMDGIKGLVATPHIREGIYPNSRDEIMDSLHELRTRLSNRIDIKIYSGAEVHIAMDLVEKINRNEIMSINEEGYLLLELPEHLLPPRTEDLLFNLKLAKITPIIAHPERCSWAVSEFNRLEKFIEDGALVQITAMSLTGGFGKAVRSVAKKLLKLSLVDVIASDSHSAGHRPPKLSGALEAAVKIVGEEAAEKLVKENPQRIIDGKQIEGRG
ncbi:MAG: CpsB/CapC family capsule biosynthesis tyrosine phosphatase [Thermodesulfobacteriota bacterium]